jgi:ribosomal protein L7/L12
MENKLLSIVSMLTSSDKITLFTSAGEMIQISNDSEDYDCAKIVTYLTPLIKGTNVVEIDLSEFSKLAYLLNTMQLEEQGVVITYMVGDKEVRGIFYPEKVAVTVNLPTGEKVEIPDVTNMTAHMVRAKEENSPSVANFFRRLAPIMKDRRHSAEDLMKFIKKSEMPLTNDGRIICYKRVTSISGKEGYFDCHTGKVNQDIGTRVSMDVALVDPSRHQSCSQGLHVANLGYMQGFSGSHTLIVLVNPEDFIAVPHGEDTKARVSVYDVVGILNPKSHDQVNTGSHVKNDAELKELIQRLITGNVVSMTKFVKVGRQGQILEQGELTVTTALPGLRTPVNVNQPKGTSLMEDQPKTKAPKPDVLQAAKQAAASLDQPETMPTDVGLAFNMLFMKKTKAEVARAFDTSTRSIGRWMEKWDFEGYVRAGSERLLAALKAPEPQVPNEANEVSQEDLAAAAELHDKIVAESKPALFDLYVEIPREKIITAIKLIRQINGLGLKEAKDLAESDGPIVTNETEYTVNVYANKFQNENFVTSILAAGSPKPIKAMTKAGRARKLYNELVLSGFSEIALHRLKDFKKESKKGWLALGFTDHEIGRIEDAS